MQSRRLGTFLLCLFAATTALALPVNEWAYRQPVQVPAGGLVKFDVPAATLDAARADLADLRLLDPQGREVPLLLEHPRAPQTVALAFGHDLDPHRAADPDPPPLRRAFQLGARLRKPAQQVDDDIAVESKAAHFLMRFFDFAPASVKARIASSGSIWLLPGFRPCSASQVLCISYSRSSCSSNRSGNSARTSG